MEYLAQLLRFRNEHHFHWFLYSVVALVLSLTFFMWFKMRYLFWYFALFHAGTTVLATRNLLRHEPNPLYSVDCIWFNGGMVLVYMLLLRRTRKARSP